MNNVTKPTFEELKRLCDLYGWEIVDKGTYFERGNQIEAFLLKRNGKYAIRILDGNLNFPVQPNQQTTEIGWFVDSAIQSYYAGYPNLDELSGFVAMITSWVATHNPEALENDKPEEFENKSYATILEECYLKPIGFLRLYHGYDYKLVETAIVERTGQPGKYTFAPLENGGPDVQKLALVGPFLQFDTRDELTKSIPFSAHYLPNSRKKVLDVIDNYEKKGGKS